MSTSSTSDPDDEQRQTDVVNQQTSDDPISLVKDNDRCQAIAVTTSQQCEKNAIDGLPYCPRHFDLLDLDEIA